jgi:hypothetical protein
MSLLPDKTIRTEYSLIGVGAIILQSMTLSETITSLWGKSKDYEQINTYEKFISGMVFLYTIGAIKYNDGVITKK